MIVDLSVGSVQQEDKHLKTDKGTVLPLVTAHNGFSQLQTPTTPYVFSEHSPEEIKQLCEDMIESLYHYQGLGISANQLGLPWSVFAMRGEPADFVCFNPRVVQPSDEIVKLEEACLSFPGMVITMKRPKHGRVRFTDPTGEVTSHTFTGMTFRVFQHEMNHLNGEMWFKDCSRIHLERAVRQAKRKGFNYSAMGLMKYARR